MVNRARQDIKRDREKKVLELIVTYHISTAEPVGSLLIARDMKLSSATIRNIMLYLEEEGLIWQPHASAGRIPSDKGYRVYVDSLMETKEFLEPDAAYADQAFYNLRSDSIEDVLLKGLQLCSKITNQACIALFPTLKIKERLIEKLEEEMRSILTSLYDFEDRLYFDGTHYLVEKPEFKDSEKICAVLKALEDKKELLDVLEGNIREDGVQIYIGAENKSLGFVQCTLITANYSVEDGITGTLGIVGPMRMQYERVIPTVNCIAGSISRLLHEMA